MITIKQSGSFSNAEKFLKKLSKKVSDKTLKKYGEAGVAALSAATPVDTGLTASSWYYDIVRTKTGLTIEFHNSNVQRGVPIAIILQYGHATRNGGWVEGIDYINPALKPVFDKMASDLWKEVKR